MDNLALIGLLGGFIWGTAGIVGYPGVAWKPGAIITVAAAIWLLKHDAMPPEPLVEAGAIGIFLVLMSALKRRHPAKRED